jgi:hypothetical protein
MRYEHSATAVNAGAPSRRCFLNVRTQRVILSVLPRIFSWELSVWPERRDCRAACQPWRILDGCAFDPLLRTNPDQSGKQRFDEVDAFSGSK